MHRRAGTLVMNQGINVSGGGNFIVTSEQPKGPWSAPYYLGEEAQGIDPSLFFDEDDKCYYVGTRPNPSGVRHNGDWEIWIQELDISSMKLTGESMAVWKGALKDCIWPEGPHLYKKDGYYYLMIAEGGTGPEHSISAARSKALFSWFEGCLRNPVFTHRNLGMDYPMIYAGHGDLVDDGNGNWYVVMLASRPCKRHCSMGRETFLAKVTWEDGWPVINAGIGHLTEKVELQLEECRFVDEITHTDCIRFFQKGLDQRLVSLQNCGVDQFSLSEHPGFLRLYLGKEQISEPVDAAFYGLSQKDYEFHISAGVEFVLGQEWETAGLVLFQNHRNHLRFEIAVKKGMRLIRLVSCIKETDLVIAEKQVSEGGMLELHIKAVQQEAEFFVRGVDGSVINVNAASENDAAVTEKVSLLPFTTEEAGGFVGCTIGLYASANGKESSNYADFGWLTYEGEEK